MANKRTLKKQIRYACGDLAAECIIAMNCVEGINVDKMQEIVFEIASLQSISLRRVTFIFDKGKKDFESTHEYSVSRAKYFKYAYAKLRNDFGQKVLEIVSSMNALLPQSQKDANKKALNQ